MVRVYRMIIVAMLAGSTGVGLAQRPPEPLAAKPAEDTGPVGPLRSDRFRTTYVRLGRDAEGLLYEPTAPQLPSPVALVFSHPSANVFGEAPGAELAARGFRILMVNYRGGSAASDAYLPSISRGIGYLRSLPEVRKVVVLGHSGGGHLIPLYANVALNGRRACSGPEKIYPCAGDLNGLARPDGMVLLDPTLGALHQASSVDPATGEARARQADLDMFAPSNGYDPATGAARYGPAFARRFFAAQGRRNNAIVADARYRLQVLGAGRGSFTDDEPLVIRGMGVNAAGARLYQPDTSYVAHTRRPHVLLRADGSTIETIVRSVRPPSGQPAAREPNSLAVMTQNTTVRAFLANSAIRTLPDYGFTVDDVTGVDWASAMTSAPGNAEGIRVPSLVMTMGCHYLVVPGEIVFDRLAAADKTYAAVEGATHLFSPCAPQYGDTRKRTFDYVARWLSQPGRF